MQTILEIFGVRRRLILLGLGVALIGALIVALTLDSERRAGATRARLGEVDMASFQIVDHFRATARSANDHVRRYATTHEAPAWSEFLRASEELRTWIGRQRLVLTTPEETRILAEMTEAYKAYRRSAEELRTRMDTAHETSVSLEEFNGFSSASRRLQDLGLALGRAHFDSRNGMLGSASETLKRLRLSVLGLVGVLFALGAVLVVVIYRDLISPLQIKLVASQALAERNEKLASLGVLAAGVAHEIRNPLTAIKTTLFSQQKKLPADSPARKDAEVVEREISRLDRIVTGFLQFARPSDPDPVVFPAEQALRRVAELMRAPLAASGIQLVCEEPAPARLRADPAQVQQVLINLVQNAADSIGRDGRVALRARTDRRWLREKETAVVVLEVADTGTGIPPEVEKRLFDPFFTTKAGGSGLGLSVASRLVEMNGGVLQYQTRLNHGSVFGVVFPLVES